MDDQRPRCWAVVKVWVDGDLTGHRQCRNRVKHLDEMCHVHVKGVDWDWACDVMDGIESLPTAMPDRER